MGNKRLLVVSVSLFVFLGFSRAIVGLELVRFEPTKSIYWFLVGRQLNITCTANSTKEAAKLDIIKTVQGEFKKESRIEKQPGGNYLLTTSLIKPSASLLDSAQYLCSLDLIDAVYQSFEAFNIFTQGANITEGLDTQIRCDPHLHTDHMIGWYKDDLPLDSIPSLRGRIEISQDNKTVVFSNAKPSDGGVYICRIVISPNTIDEMVFVESVYLQAKPYILPGAVTNVTNSSIVLTCPVVGYPPPDIFWQRGKEVLSSRGNVHLITEKEQNLAQLVITNASGADYGTYSCIADNWLGKAEQFYQVDEGSQSRKQYVNTQTV